MAPSLHPLTMPGALKGAMETGRLPERPKGKRKATKRKLKGEDRQRGKNDG